MTHAAQEQLKINNYVFDTNHGILPEVVDTLSGKTELETFKIFVDDELIDLMVRETNRYAEQVIIGKISDESITQHSRLNDWVDTNAIEMHVFLGIILWMGLDKKPSLSHYWSRSELYNSPACKFMSRNRFEILLRMWHFGTLRSNRKCNPKQVTKSSINRGEIIGMESDDGITVFKWKDKRDVLMLSTKHSIETADIGQRQKPIAVIDYNAGKTFIDVSDQRASYSSAVRKALKWYRKVAVEALLGTTVVNSLFLYNKVNGKNISIIKFREKLCSQLLHYGQPVDLENIARQPLTAHKLEVSEKNSRVIRSRCKSCYTRFSEAQGRKYAMKMAKTVRYVCVGCPEKPHMCKECFYKLHKIS